MKPVTLLPVISSAKGLSAPYAFIIVVPRNAMPGALVGDTLSTHKVVPGVGGAVAPGSRP